MDNPLISVDEHELRMDQFRARLSRDRQHTGVACPSCPDRELQYADDLTLASLPPRRNVVCPRCGTRTTISV